MTKTTQKEFTKLMSECHQQDVEAMGFSAPDAGENVFALKEDRYRQLRLESECRREHLDDISAILNHSQNSNCNQTQSIDFIKDSIEKAHTDITNFTSFLMPHRFAPLLLNKGKVLFSQERFNEAITCWEKVLKVEPHNQVIKTNLLNLVKKKTLYAETVQRLLNRYRLEFIKSFGHGYTGQPFHILMLEPETILYVADHETHKVVKFNEHLQFVGEFCHDVKHPCGMFHDEHKLIWICDFGNSRLLAVNSLDQVIEQINIQDLVGKDFPATCPLDGCVQNGKFHLILRDQHNQHSHIISFDRHDRRNSLKVIFCDVEKAPCNIRYFNGELFVSMANPLGIYVFDTSSNEFKPWSTSILPSPLRRFVKVGGFFYITAGEYLFKISKNETIFSADIRHLTGLKSAIHVSLTVTHTADEQFLILSDVIQGCLHYFKI